MKDPQVILSHLKEIEYIFLGSEIWSDWGKKVIGWNASASSIVRCDYTISRLKDEISELHLPLKIEIKDCVNSFRLMIV